ncbi:MAG: hypothetical protein ACKVX7_14905 [Planctomycetota bacterium]
MTQMTCWLALASMSVMLLVDLPQPWRVIFGALGFLLSLVGAALAVPPSAPTAAPIPSSEPLDRFHEVVVAEICDGMAPLDAAALVGVLTEHRLTVRGNFGTLPVEALTVEAAVSIVSHLCRLAPRRLRRLYEDHWARLRGEAKVGEMCRRLSTHPRVMGVHRIPNLL